MRESFYLSESPTRLRKDEERWSPTELTPSTNAGTTPCESVIERCFVVHTLRFVRFHARESPDMCTGSCLAVTHEARGREEKVIASHQSPLSRLVCLRMGAAWRFEEEKTVEDGSLIQRDTCLSSGAYRCRGWNPKALHSMHLHRYTGKTRNILIFLYIKSLQCGFLFVVLVSHYLFYK